MAAEGTRLESTTEVDKRSMRSPGKIRRRVRNGLSQANNFKLRPRKKGQTYLMITENSPSLWFSDGLCSIPLKVPVEGHFAIEVDVYVKIFVPGIIEILGKYEFAAERFPLEVEALPEPAAYAVWLLKRWNLEVKNRDMKKPKSNHIFFAAREACATIEHVGCATAHEATFLTLERLLNCYTGGITYGEAGGKPNMFVCVIGYPSGNNVEGALSETEAIVIVSALQKKH